MFVETIKQLKTSIIFLFLMTILTGFLYPTIITLVAQTIFPWQANGSLIKHNHIVVGSKLIGQSFTASNYFWGRPSATQPFPYNAASSGGSNLGPSNPALEIIVKNRITQLQAADPHNKGLIPVDLVTASGSGLDPEISPLAAFYQVQRIALARQLPEEQIQSLIEKSIQKPTFAFLGAARINVLQLNLALENLQSSVGKNNGN